MFFAVSSVEQGACGPSIVKISLVEKADVFGKSQKHFLPHSHPQVKGVLRSQVIATVLSGVEQQRQSQCQLSLATVVTSLRISRKLTDLGPMVPFHVDSRQLVLKLISYSTILCQLPYEVTSSLSCSSSVEYTNNNNLSGTESQEDQ